MLKDYVCLMKQAEEIECNKNKYYYNKAIEILNQNKGQRISQILSDLEIIIDMLLVEFQQKYEIQERDLVIGCHAGSFRWIVEKYGLLIDLITQNEKSLDKEVKEIKQRYEQYYNFNIE